MKLRPLPFAAALTLAATAAFDGPATAESPFAGDRWRQNGFAIRRFEIGGTGGRNNPLRHPLQQPSSADELFVRYRLRYDAASIDTPENGNGEFFVLWLDESEGGDGSTHGDVPNVGLHVSDGENRFMIRFNSRRESFGPAMEGDRDYRIVARLWKSDPGPDRPFDQLDLWVDPPADAENRPDASTKGGSLTEVAWLGFSTGAKTEPSDRIEVWDIDVATDWATINNLPPEPEPAGVSVPVAPAEKTVDFRNDVHPILASRCFGCHRGEDREAELRLDHYDELLNQTTPWDAAASPLIRMVRDGEMPPDGPPLKESELAVLEAWIDEGVEWDETLLPTPIPETDHWAFRPIRRPTLPKVQRKGWVRTPVDRFIAAEQERLGIEPAAEAAPQILRRRMHLDLLGLPPEPAASPMAENDTVVPGGDAAGDPLVNFEPHEDVAAHADGGTLRDGETLEALLADPAYGERWGRHWLDVARWAESNGYQHNRPRPHAWRYRDYVIDAFNRDKPFNEFIREQIAGDEIASGPDTGSGADSGASPHAYDPIVATGFLAAARYSGNELDKAIQRNDLLVDVTNTTAEAFLGLTIQCAQCHTHKFDPISIRDYYRFQAFFTRGQPGNIVISGHDAQRLVSARWQLFESVRQRLVAVKRKQGHPEPISVTPNSVVSGMRPDERDRFDTLEARVSELPQSWGYYAPLTAGRRRPIAPHEMRSPLPHDPRGLAKLQTHLLLRGDVTAPGPAVDPGWPIVFGPTPSELDKPRAALADWIASPGNPLTARVWANRVWQWHFGRGLVETSGDFGAQGTEPTHPDLLDYLASELIDSGWSTKHLHRLIVDSATYRQSAAFSKKNHEQDPENRARWRWDVRRLEAEAVRDSILSVAGELDPTQGGPSVPPDGDSSRRAVYLAQQRDRLPEQQRLFDSANGVSSCARRPVSTTPLQPLWLMNSDFVQSAARALAERAETPREIIPIAIGRDATDEEIKALQSLAERFGLESAALAVLNSSEFLYVP